MHNNRKPYAMGGVTDALSVAPTANYTGGTMIQDMSDAWPGGNRRKKSRPSKKANTYNKRCINRKGNTCYNPNRG